MFCLNIIFQIYYCALKTSDFQSSNQQCLPSVRIPSGTIVGCGSLAPLLRKGPFEIRKIHTFPSSAAHTLLRLRDRQMRNSV